MHPAHAGLSDQQFSRAIAIPVPQTRDGGAEGTCAVDALGQPARVKARYAPQLLYAHIVIAPPEIHHCEHHSRVGVREG